MTAPPSADRSRQAVVIHNPAAGSRDTRADVVEACHLLSGRGWSIDLKTTHAPGDAGRLVRAAADAGVPVVLVAGGDGTLNEAVNALVGTSTCLGVLPCGTANMWAQQLGLPLSGQAVLEAAHWMDMARIRPIDVGQVTVGIGSEHAQSRYFLLWSGLGLDAYVTRSVEPRPASIKRWGKLGYGLAALRSATTFRGLPADIEVDGCRISARSVLIVVSNIQWYAGYFHLAPEAQVDDGWLEVIVVRGQGFLAAAMHFVRILLNRYVRDPRLTTFRARRVRVTTRGHCDVHVDAEPIGATPAECVVVSRALRVLVPPSAPTGLFAPDPEKQT